MSIARRRPYPGRPRAAGTARAMRAIPLVLVLACLLPAAGCVEREAEVDPFVSAGGGMMEEGGGDGESMVTGVVATAENARIDVYSIQADPRELIVERVIAPADGWILARSVRPIGSVLGATRVKKGENRDLRIAMKDADSQRVRITLHTDGGIKSELEFDPDRVERSPDRAVYVDRKPLEVQVELRGFGVEGEPHEMTLWVQDQRVEDGRLLVRHAWVPEPSWLLVATWENDRPVRRVAVQGLDAENEDFLVELEDPKVKGDLILMLIADAGEKGKFEYLLDDPLNSVDQPYALGDDFMRRIVTVR